METGLVASLARPGANVTGVTNLTPRLSAKRLELLRDVQPTLSRVAVLWRLGNTGTELAWRESQEAARTLGLHLISLELHGPEDFDAAFEATLRDRAEALVTLTDTLVNTNRRRIVEFAAHHRLPGMYNARAFTLDGGLMAYGANQDDYYRRAAAIVEKILKGAKPADIPVEQPMRFDFVLNLQAARDLGLTFPQHILLQATEVID